MGLLQNELGSAALSIPAHNSCHSEWSEGKPYEKGKLYNSYGESVEE